MSLLDKEQTREIILTSLGYLIIKDENGIRANINYLENLTEDLDLVDRVIKYINCSNEQTLENIIIEYYSNYILNPINVDELCFFKFIDKIYIKNNFLNKLIYFKNGKIYFTKEARNVAQKYNVTITNNDFPNIKPLIIHGSIPLHEFMYKLRVDYKLRYYEIKRFEDNILYFNN